MRRTSTLPWSDRMRSSPMAVLGMPQLALTPRLPGPVLGEGWAQVWQQWPGAAPAGRRRRHLLTGQQTSPALGPSTWGKNSIRWAHQSRSSIASIEMVESIRPLSCACSPLLCSLHFHSITICWQ